MSNDDNKIIEELRKGNIITFEKIFTQYYPSLLIYAKTIVGRTENAKDIIQDFFLKFWEQKERIIISTSIKSYIFSSVKNSCLDFIKHAKVIKKYSDSAKLQIQEIGLSYLDKIIEKEEQIINQQIQTELIKAIEELPEKSREIFKMSKFEGMKSKEIAEKLGVSVRTVENQVYRSILNLRDKLSKARTSLKSFLYIFFSF